MSPSALAALALDVATKALFTPSKRPPADSSALFAPLVAVMALSLTT